MMIRIRNSKVQPTTPQTLYPGVELEYKTLRDEILTRIRLRQQLLVISLTFAATVLSLSSVYPHILLIYPLLASLIALGWVQNDHRIGNIGRYIRKYIESEVPAMGWETVMQRKRSDTGLSSWRYITVSNLGLILFVQIFAISLGIEELQFKLEQWILIVIDAASVIVVLVLMYKSLHRKRKKKKPNMALHTNGESAAAPSP